jgi:hypothetical protein
MDEFYAIRLLLSIQCYIKLTPHVLFQLHKTNIIEIISTVFNFTNYDNSMYPQPT